MKKKILKNFFALALSLVMVSATMPVLAAGIDIWGEDTNSTLKTEVAGEIGYSTSADTDPRILAAKIIKVILGFLGIIAVILIIYAGFKWMIGGSGADNKDARNIMVSAAIGLLIIFAAWALTDWVIEQIQNTINS